MALSELSDERLMRDAASGRFGAFEDFMDRHQGRILNFLWRLSGSEDTARTLFEGTWSELYKLRASQPASQSAQTLLFSLATRKAMRLLAENPSLAIPRGAAMQGDKASLQWRSARLNDALLSLPLRERAALLLCFFDSLSYIAAAACLNEREENLRTLCGQGLGRLRETLGEGFLSAGLP
jgi:RNA polymerase sigma-70 factor (ECF subfamily)